MVSTPEDLNNGLVHPKRAGATEDLFAKLARFAELTQPSELSSMGVSETNKVAPDDPRLEGLLPALKAIGQAPVDVYLRTDGGFVCDMMVGGAPALLMGAAMSEATPRERLFLQVRSAELYRSGHTLCERLGEKELGGMIAALCMAIEPNTVPKTATEDTPHWGATIGGPMTDEIRAQMAPFVLTYLQASGEEDVGAWRIASLASADRVALVLCSDLTDAISALLRKEGLEDASVANRSKIVQENPEWVALFSFAISQEYFALRRALGLAVG